MLFRTQPVLVAADEYKHGLGMLLPQPVGTARLYQVVSQSVGLETCILRSAAGDGGGGRVEVRPRHAAAAKNRRGAGSGGGAAAASACARQASTRSVARRRG